MGIRASKIIIIVRSIGLTNMITAASGLHLQAVRALLAVNANENARDRKGLFPLYVTTTTTTTTDV